MTEKTYTWDAKDYARHSAGQYKWALELIDKLRLAEDETVLDIGCGDGKVTQEIAARAPQGQVTGVDRSFNMVRLAHQQFSAPNALPTHHAALRFLQMDAAALAFDQGFDVAFSNATLHWVKDHPQVLAGLARSLKKQGRFLLQMGGRGNAADVNAVMDTVRARPDWSAYFRDFVFPYTLHGPEEYELMLADAGLHAKRIELIPKDMQHAGRDGLAGWLRTTWLPYTGRVPAERREAFLEEVLDEYLHRLPIDDQGIAHVQMVRLEVEGTR